MQLLELGLVSLLPILLLEYEPLLDSIVVFGAASRGRFGGCLHVVLFVCAQ